ncbi:MAG: VWA domain-containing protein [Gammaproteobacteria bacterium]|nr:VWA domain-containing protein [Gammaproteobacteria bacterium]
MPDIQFTHLPLLLMLPLALLPLLQRKNESLVYSWNYLLPQDRVGPWLEWLRRALALLTISAIIVGLAGPGRSETQIERIGRGAELSIVLDRSSSMDRNMWRNGISPENRGKRQDYVQKQKTISKNDAVRDALGWLLTQRPDNRYALTLFNAAPIRVAPFTDNVSLVQAGLDASDIGRGPSETNMGLGLLAAIDAFAGRSYSGSRAILLVSDGGAKLKEEIRNQIAAGLVRNRVNLYFIYIQSSANSPNLELVGTDVDSTLDEVALHVFFQGLESEYRVFQASDLESMEKAVQIIDEQQNLPLTYYERVPRVDYSQRFYLSALLSCALLLLLSVLKKQSWL